MNGRIAMRILLSLTISLLTSSQYIVSAENTYSIVILSIILTAIYYQFIPQIIEFAVNNSSFFNKFKSASKISWEKPEMIYPVWLLPSIVGFICVLATFVASNYLMETYLAHPLSFTLDTPSQINSIVTSSFVLTAIAHFVAGAIMLTRYLRQDKHIKLTSAILYSAIFTVIVTIGILGIIAFTSFFLDRL